MSKDESRIRKKVIVEPTLADVDDMPVEYMNHNEKNLTKRQRLLVWNAVNDPTLTFAEAAKKAAAAKRLQKAAEGCRRQQKATKSCRRAAEELQNSCKNLQKVAKKIQKATKSSKSYKELYKAIGKLQKQQKSTKNR